MEDQEISIFPEYTVVYAGFWQRFAAAFLDGLILLIPNYIIGRFIGGQNFYKELISWDVHTSSVIGNLLQTLLGLIYFAAMESGPARATVGKQAIRLQVTTLSGEQESFARAFGRNFGKNLSTLLILLGYFMMLWDDKNQTLHDKMAGTVVIQRPPGA